MTKSYPIHKNVIKRYSKKQADELHEKLLQEKETVQNQPHLSKGLSLLGKEQGGDQADQVNRLQEEIQYTGQIQRNNLRLKQVVDALMRMERGDYGVCEETETVIEFKRLSLIPWTTLSIQGSQEREYERNKNLRAFKKVQ